MHSLGLKGKRVLIVGGGGEGIGGAITQRAAAEMPEAVAVVGRDATRTQAAADGIASSTGRALAVCADIRVPGEIEAAVQRAAGEFGGLDVLITVVGGAGLFVPWQPLDHTSDDEWRLIFEVNLDYVFHALRATIPFFLAAGGGTIVSVGSLSGTHGTPMGAAYGAAKAGLINLAASVSAEYGRRNIRMNVVNCGLISTPAAAATNSFITGITDAIPVGRAGTPQEVAELVTFLASSSSSYLSGQAINLDGGATARYPLALPNTDHSMAG